MTLLVTAALAACFRHRDPQAAYDHALETFRHGDMPAAGIEAEKDYKEFRSVSREWAWKFTILRARILYAQGMNEAVLKLLTSEPDARPSGDLAIRQLWLEGLAYTSLSKFSDAELRFEESERLCGVSNSSVCTNVISAQGALEMQRGQYAQAQVFFERALDHSRANATKSPEPGPLLDLSWSALRLAHFDEALDWANAARSIALAQGSAGAAQTALGNMGWAYYKLGDLEKAEGMFIEAEAQAEKLGQTSSQIGWLIDAGYVDLDRGRLPAAQQAFEQSLKLARKIGSREDIVTALQALAFVSERTDKLDEAKRYADDARSMAQADRNGRDIVYARLVQGRVSARLHDTKLAKSNFIFVAESKDTPVFLKWEAERSLARL